uniref:tRNA (32-2'-O)-methyltransferase regulator THADA n=3 Tax=Photinus pyralis TaxID=7054 RepID=A0A1Y1MLP0_PHOPY
MKPRKIVGPVFRRSCSCISECRSNNSNEHFRYIIEKCSETTECCLQQESVKRLSEYLKSALENEEKSKARKLLAHMYLSCTAKHPIKKSMKCMIQVHIKNEDVEREDTDHFINSLYTSFDILAARIAILENVHELFSRSCTFLNELVENLWERSKDILSSQLLHTYLYNTTKFLLCLSQNYNTSNISLNDKISLIKSLYELILHINVAYDVKCNSGHMMVMLCSTTPEMFPDGGWFKEHPYLELLKETGSSDFFRHLGMRAVGDASMKELLNVCLYIGISIVAPSDVLYKGRIGHEIILCFMLQKLIRSATSSGIKTNISRMMGISKAITTLSSHLSYLEVDELSNIYRQCLDYINVYIDDVPDVVKNNTQAMFKSLIKVTLKAKAQGCSDYFNTLFKWVNDLGECSNFYAIIMVLCSEVGCSVVLQQHSNLPVQMVDDVICSGKAANVVTSYERLMKIHWKEVQSYEQWLQAWVEEIVARLANSDEPQQIFQELFIAAFKIDSKAITSLIKKQHLSTDSEILALLGCIHYCRKNGIDVNLSGYCTKSNGFWRNYLDYQTLNILKTHLNDEIRICILAIVVNSHSSTEVFSEWELNFLIEYCYYNVSVPNGSFRQKLISCTKKVMMRVKDVTNVFENKILSAKSLSSDDLREKLLQKLSADVTPVLTAYANFWKFLFGKVLLPGIYLDSNYDRKATCLEILYFSSTMMPKQNFEKLWKHSDVENLKHILEYDTYEQNKETASKLLAEFSTSFFNFNDKDVISTYLDQCLSMALNIKPSRTISAAYMINLSLKVPGICDIILQKIKIRDPTIFKDSENILSDATYLMVVLLELELRDCLRSAQEHIHHAVTTKPTHGLLFSIRYILKNFNPRKKCSFLYWKMLIKRLIFLCLEVSEVANTIVCNDSPEGYVPDDSDVYSDDTAKSQVVTVYGWRATKEISLLFGELAQFSSNKDNGALVNEDQLRCLGKYFFDLLINTKHRGAFEQASVGFSNLCSVIWRLEGTSVSSLPAQWLGDITAILNGASFEGVKSCETRRSAGIPFMVQAILSTEPITASSKLFEKCMNVLLDICGNNSLPFEQRVLGLNILRALFRHNQLGEVVMPHCAHGLKIAIRGFSSSAWGIRNSSTLLFSALIMRIFGVQRLRDMELISIKNKMQGQIFFVRFPDLFKFLLEQLEVASHEVYHPSLYPILLVLNRLYSNKETLDRVHLDAFLPYMEFFLSNPSHKIRNLAAQATASLIEINKLPHAVVSTIVSLTDATISNNYCHGLLQKFHYLLHSPYNTIPYINIEKFVEDTSWILLLCGQNVQWITGVYYLETLLHLIIRYDPDFHNIKVFKTIMKILWFQEEQEWIKNVTKKYNERVLVLKLAYILHVRNHSGSLTEADYKEIIEGDLSNYAHLQHMALVYLNYMKFMEPVYKNYELCLEDDSEYSVICDHFLKPLSDDSKSFLYSILLSTLWKSIEDNTENIHCAIDTLLLHDLTDLQKATVYQLIQNNAKRYMKSSDEEFYCFILAYLSNNNCNQRGNFGNLIHVFRKCASPIAENSLRLVLSKFLVANRRLFYWTDSILQGTDLYQIWEIVFTLLEDDDEDVRNTVCQLSQQNLGADDSNFSLLFQLRVDIPEYTRDLLLDQMVNVLPKESSFKMLLSLCLRSRFITNDNLSEVFEEGAINTHIEYWPIAKSALKRLEYLLCEDENIKSSNLKDSRILRAQTLHNVISHNEFPLISSATKSNLCAILEDIIHFRVADSGCNIEKEFLNNLKHGIPSNLDSSESLRIKMLLTQLFTIC